MQKSNTSLKNVLQELQANLDSDEAETEARIILETILNISPTELHTDDDLHVTKSQLLKINRIRDKRNQDRIPLAYLLEEARFRDLKLFVNSDVLIPRPETEILVQETLKEIKERKIHQPSILDLGTGSGCIAIALKLALPAAKVYACDISKAALSVAAINAKRYEAEIEFVMGDYLDPFLNLSTSPVAVPVMKSKPPHFDVIVSNPPYVSEEDYAKLEAEIHHEPKHALVGFPYEHIKKQTQGLIKDNGFIALEFGIGQEDKLLEIYPEAKIYPDLAGINRVLIWNEQPDLILGFKPL